MAGAPGHQAGTLHPDGSLDANGIRGGRVFVTTGDLISELFVTARAADAEAGIGGRLTVPAGTPVEVTIRFLDPEAPNHHDDNPTVQRVDLIVGQMHGQANDPAIDTHSHVRVAERFSAADWRREGNYRVIDYRLDALDRDHYIRVRGTNTEQLEPALDPRGEDPWSDLWFYSNPVRLLVD